MENFSEIIKTESVVIKIQLPARISYDVVYVVVVKDLTLAALMKALKI